MIRINNWGINARAIFLAMAPVLLVTVVLASYINTARNNDLDQELDDKGVLIAKSLSSVMEFSVATGNLLQIKSLAEATITKNDVVGIRVTDINDELIYQIGVTDETSKGIKHYIVKIVSSAIDYEELFSQIEPNKSEQERFLGYVDVHISTAPYLIRQKNINTTTVFIAVGGLLLSLFMALFIARGVTGPVRRIIETVEALSSGDLDARMQEISGGELGKLRDGLNVMAETIQNSQEQLKGMVDDAVFDLEKKVRELEIKNDELDIARNEAMQAKDAKSDFLASMSHEIRTPLNAVIGFSRQLGKGELNGQQEEYTRAINSAARQLLIVIDDILSFSKLESDKMNIVSSELRLRECLEDTILMLSQSASEKNVEMVLLIDADIPDVVMGDPDRISQVVVNLVNNAIKFTDNGSIVIHVQNELDSDAIHFSISDTGCGISEEAQKNIFTPFYQENQKSSKRHGGTGLGLIICKRLVEMMKGDIGFTSEQGAGTEFYFNLPMITVTDHDVVLIENDINVFVLDAHALSLRAIRNTLVHMEVNTFAVANMDKLLDTLSNNAGNKDDVVMLSLPAGYKVSNFSNEYLDVLRKKYKGNIIVLMSGDYFDTYDLTNLDEKITVIGKPLRSSSLLGILSRGAVGTAIVENKTAHQADNNRNYFTRSILVAEDNDLNQQYIMGLLSGYKVNTVCVDTGTKAVEACKNIHFDLIFMDLHMPDLDGVEATKQIRQLQGVDENMPIIAITADVFANEDDQLIQQGFTGCMFKPIDEDKLKEVVNTYISSRFPDSDAQSVSKMSIAGDLPEDMIERLFINLYDAYFELEKSFTEQNNNDAREAAHKLLGLVCYFKVGNLADDIRLLQDAIKKSDFTESSRLLDECINYTHMLEKRWRTS